MSDLITSINTLTIKPTTTKAPVAPVTKLTAQRSCLSYEEAYQRYMRNFCRVCGVVVGESNPLTHEQETPAFYVFNRNFETLFSTPNVYTDNYSERFTDAVHEVMRGYRLNFRDVEKAESIEDFVAGTFMEFKGEYEDQIKRASQASELEIAPSSTEFLNFAADCETFCEYERYRKYYYKEDVLPDKKWLPAIEWYATVGKVRLYTFA